MKKNLFFCGIGGSGMMPLALLQQAKGHIIHGSDRAYDQGQSPEKFSKLKSLGVNLHKQDGSGITAKTDCLITSTAIESTIPDVAAAQKLGTPIQSRAECLAELINAARTSICVAGTSGKSTVTGMIATIFEQTGHDPVVMNGGLIENFSDNPQSPAANMRIGAGDVFISESDESDGSIALYRPSISVINNIALDHMSMEELQTIFMDFANRTEQTVCLNIDNPYVAKIAKETTTRAITYSHHNQDADIKTSSITLKNDGSEFTINDLNIKINVAGEHNISNALAALAVATSYGIRLEDAAKALQSFKGIKRRLQIIGAQNGTTVIDDFAHNPDKIAASLKTLKQSGASLTIIFQPHGFAPLRLMGKEIIDSFAQYLTDSDALLMPEVYYAGGTVDRSVTAKDIITSAQERDINAHWFVAREEIINHIKNQKQKTDIIAIMGARDDTLTHFAKEILAAV